MTKIALLTTGHIHTPGFVKMLKARADVQIAWVWDSNAVLAEKYAKELNAPMAKCWKDVLKDDSVEAVVFTGTTAQHDQIAVAAANAKNHLFVEKPLATTAAEACRIFTAVKENKVIFQTGHFLRGMSHYRFIKQEIDAGNLGTITRARHSNCHHGALAGWFDTDYRWFFQKDQSGGGGFNDLGCHSVDLLVHFLGPIESVTAAMAPKTIKYSHIDEYGEGLFKFKSGVIGTAAGSWVDVSNPVSFLVTGTEGHITVMNGQVYYLSKKTAIPGADGKTPMDKSLFPPELPHAFELFFDVLGGKAEKGVLIPIEDALNVTLAMEAMYLADKLGQWVKV